MTGHYEPKRGRFLILGITPKGPNVLDGTKLYETQEDAVASLRNEILAGRQHSPCMVVEIKCVMRPSVSVSIDS